MKSFASVVALSFAQAALAQNLFEQIAGPNRVEAVSDVKEMELPLSSKFHKNQFGCLGEESVFANNYTEKVIKAPLVPFHMDYP